MISKPVKLALIAFIFTALAGCSNPFCGITTVCETDKKPKPPVNYLPLKDAVCQPSFNDMCNSSIEAKCAAIRNVSSFDAVFSGYLNIKSNNSFSKKPFEKKFIPAGETLYFEKSIQCKDGKPTEEVVSVSVSHDVKENNQDREIGRSIKYDGLVDCPQNQGQSCSLGDKPKCHAFFNKNQ